MSRPRTMRAVVIHQHGGPEVLKLEVAWPKPIPGRTEILVKVEACGLNYLDIFVRNGMPGEAVPLPMITGGDVAGTVVAHGENVTSPALGTRVVLDPNWGCGVCEYCRDGLQQRCLCGHMLGERDNGGLAEFVKCPAKQAIPIPSDYSFEEAACLPIAFGTAYRMVITRGRVRPDDVVVVLAAGGGVALAALQMAKLVGARVVATASSDEKLERARKFGADYLINHSNVGNWDESIRTITRKRGADVVIETVGAVTWEKSIRCLGKGGRLITCGATSGPLATTDIRYIFRREHNILGSDGWTHNELRRVTSLAFQHKLQPVIHTVLPLEKIAEAEQLLEDRAVFGKVIVTPGAPNVAR
jgi:NADPH:quinone reductase-like Zn-dependent oxidoreductase